MSASQIIQIAERLPLLERLEIIDALNASLKRELTRNAPAAAEAREKPFEPLNFDPGGKAPADRDESGLRNKQNSPPARESSQPRLADQIPPDREAEMQWLLDHPDFWHQHRGEHVALWDYEMIAVSKSAKEVYAEARRRGIKFPFVQYLPVHEHE